MIGVSDVPKNPVTRAAKMARLPIGLAGRTAIGVGKRIGGRPAEIVAQEIQQRTAEQIFRVLGELKGGAMKLGQALSIFEAALPPEIAGPYRATLTKLQEAAPPLPAAHRAPGADRAARRRTGGTASPSSTTRPPPRPRSARCTRPSGTTAAPVAVKIQYPGAGQALLGDFNQLSRARPAVRHADARAGRQAAARRAAATGSAEELDYELEARPSRCSPTAYADDPDIYVPNVVMPPATRCW